MVSAVRQLSTVYDFVPSLIWPVVILAIILIVTLLIAKVIEPKLKALLTIGTLNTKAAR